MSVDKFRDDTPNKPNCGVVKIHDEKGNAAHPSAGVVDYHPEKRKGHEVGTPNPSAGVHDRGKDPKNANTPSAGVHDEHKKKVAFDDRHDEADRKRL